MQPENNLTEALKRWLKYRQELIIQFNALCYLRPFSQNPDTRDLEASLLTFCQVLLDYVSMGQFEMFGLLLREIEKIPECTLPPKQLLDKLKETSLIALEFNDNYCSSPNFRALDTDLSYLGEHMACRFDLEDDLVAYYPLSLTVAQSKKAG